jgi:hypothetical protein
LVVFAHSTSRRYCIVKPPEFNLVALTKEGIEELKEEKVIIKPLKDYEPEIEEVYEKGVKIVSFKPKKT